MAIRKSEWRFEKASTFFLIRTYFKVISVLQKRDPLKHASKILNQRNRIVKVGCSLGLIGHVLRAGFHYRSFLGYSTVIGMITENVNLWVRHLQKRTAAHNKIRVRKAS